jgi:hypothetical protein
MGNVPSVPNFPPEKSDDPLPFQSHGLPLASREDSAVLKRGYLHVRHLDPPRTESQP